VRDDTEKTVDDLVSALCQAGQALSEQRAALIGVEGWSSVTATLELKEWHSPDGTTLAFYGNLDGERAGVGQVGWSLDVSRDGEGWLVERALTVNRNLTELETVAELPARGCSDSSDLAQSLVPLVRELLSLAAPEH
jgi:hypothetical protein